MAQKTNHSEDARRQNPCVIKVVGIGGGGCNAVNSMIRMGIEDVDFFVVNTDAQHLQACECSNKLQIGHELTKGLGCGGDPEIGREAAEAARDEITDMLCEASMVFVTTGLGGGAGTGAAPVVASVARELGILTIAIVTRPFKFEGPLRQRRAEEGLARLREASDSIIVVSNDRLLEVAGPQASLLDSFELANQVLGQGVWSIAEMISRPALIKVDFADVRTMMSGTGGAILGIGQGSGDSRSAEAVQQACSSPLLDKAEVTGARKVLISFAGPANITLHEVNEAASQVQQLANASVDLVFGVRIDDTLDNTVKVTILATGFDETADEGRASTAARSAASKPVVSATEAAPAAKQTVAAPAPVKILSAPPVAGKPAAKAVSASRPADDEDVIDLPDGDDDAPMAKAPAASGRRGSAAASKAAPRRVIALDEPPAEAALDQETELAGASTGSEEDEKDFHMAEDLKEVLARWEDEEDGEDLYKPFPPVKETAATVEREAAPVAAAPKGVNGKPARDKAAAATAKSEPTGDIFDVIDEAKGQGQEAAAGGVLHDRKGRRDATRPDPKPDEEDLEIPAFLRRRRSSFRIF